MVELPIYLRIPTENELPFFNNPSCAEVVISTVIKAQETGWLTLHGFAVLPETLEMVATPLKFSVGALVGYLESETIPLLSVMLIPTSIIWNRYFMRTPLETPRALDARLKMLLLSPVARGLCDSAESYPYSSANPRYAGTTSPYTGFQTPPQNTATTPHSDHSTEF